MTHSKSARSSTTPWYSRGYLPHFDQAAGRQFITFRLADSIPQKLIEKLEEELAKEKDKFLRLFAEFENYKKRTSKERIDLFKTANHLVHHPALALPDQLVLIPPPF